jgi:EAL domain-containing protein (putative c-di-GMP-specific phosphodiesterase class I)
MLDRACNDLADWRRRYFLADDFSVAVNVSASEFVDFRLVALVVTTLHRHRIPGRWLCLELTETAPISDFDAACQVLAELRRLGVRVAIDDYGSGYTNLHYLERLPFDMVKIDQSYVAELDRRPESAAFIARTVAAASGRHIVVAEGVQTREQAEALSSLGCEHGQGFGFGYPGPGDAVVAAWATEDARP